MVDVGALLASLRCAYCIVAGRRSQDVFFVLIWAGACVLFGEQCWFYSEGVGDVQA